MTWSDLSRAALPIVAGVAALAAAPFAQARPPLLVDDVVRAGAAYVAQFERECVSIVAHEDYEQTDKPPGQPLVRHRLQADVVLLTLGGTWLEFRDVFSVDGRAVHPRDTQLVDPFREGRGDAIKTGTRLAGQSAHYDIGALTRSTNLPMLAMTALRSDMEPGVAYTLEGDKTDRGTRVAAIQFRETGRTRMVLTEDRAPARGRIWLEAESGRVRRTELEFRTGDAGIVITVTYAPLAGATVWVPASMDETYEIGGRPSSTTNTQVVQRDGQYGGMQILIGSETMSGHKTYDHVRLGLIDTSRIR